MIQTPVINRYESHTTWDGLREELDADLNLQTGLPQQTDEQRKAVNGTSRWMCERAISLALGFEGLGESDYLNILGYFATKQSELIESGERPIIDLYLLHSAIKCQNRILFDAFVKNPDFLTLAVNHERCGANYCKFGPEYGAAAEVPDVYFLRALVTGNPLTLNPDELNSAFQEAYETAELHGHSEHTKLLKVAGFVPSSKTGEADAVHAQKSAEPKAAKKSRRGYLAQIFGGRHPRS